MLQTPELLSSKWFIFYQNRTEKVSNMTMMDVATLEMITLLFRLVGGS